MLKSIESNIRAFVKFTNSSEKLVDVYWINFNGENVLYKSLEPRLSCVINTFCTHPWIFICPDTGERLQVSHDDIFLPEAWFKYILKADNGQVSVGRQEALIHFPLRRLKDNCLWRILFLLHSRENIERLEIPNSLKNELIEFYMQSIKYTSSLQIEREDDDQML